MRNVRLERTENNSHGGHGFSVKAEDVPTEYNLVEKSVAININQAIEVRHHEVQHNVFRDLEVYSDGLKSTLGVKGIVFTGGSYNTLDRIHHYNGTDGIWFSGTTEDADSDTAGHDKPFIKTYTNCNFFPELKLAAGNKKNCLSIDPHYVDASKGDYRLKSTSGLINAGIDRAEAKYDRQNIERHSGKYSIGAYEAN